MRHRLAYKINAFRRLVTLKHNAGYTATWRCMGRLQTLLFRLKTYQKAFGYLSEKGVKVNRGYWSNDHINRSIID